MVKKHLPIILNQDKGQKIVSFEGKIDGAFNIMSAFNIKVVTKFTWKLIKFSIKINHCLWHFDFEKKCFTIIYQKLAENWPDLTTLRQNVVFTTYRKDATHRKEGKLWPRWQGENFFIFGSFILISPLFSLNKLKEGFLKIKPPPPHAHPYMKYI